MAAGSSVKRSVREQLEVQFDTYLGQVVSYLKDGYRELGFSAELVEEIAATVIVRVSHANPEPENLEQALFASADDIVRARRPRLSQQKLMERMNGPLHSDIPASLPSLRLIQRLSRVPASNTDDTVGVDALESLGRLSLPNPPVDLQASLSTNDLMGPKELEGASIPSVQIPSLKHEARFHPVIPSYDDSLDELTGLRDRSRVNERNENEGGELERELDEQLTGTVHIPKIKFLYEDSDEPGDEAPPAMRQPSILAIKEPIESVRAVFELPKSELDQPVGSMDSTLAGTHAEPQVTAPPPSASSIPPTKESIVPAALVALTGVLGAQEGAPIPKSTAAQSTAAQSTTESTATKAPRAKAKTSELKPKSVSVAQESKSQIAPKAKASAPKNAQKKQPAVASPEHLVHSFGILPDELCMLAMVGFPDNPRRAARLCVAALADELGIASADGFQGQAETVTEALASLRQGFEAAGSIHSHAALQWQRVARQATLRAFINR